MSKSIIWWLLTVSAILAVGAAQPPTCNVALYNLSSSCPPNGSASSAESSVAQYVEDGCIQALNATQGPSLELLVSAAVKLPEDAIARFELESGWAVRVTRWDELSGSLPPFPGGAVSSSSSSPGHRRGRSLADATSSGVAAAADSSANTSSSATSSAALSQVEWHDAATLAYYDAWILDSQLLPELSSRDYLAPPYKFMQPSDFVALQSAAQPQVRLYGTSYQYQAAAVPVGSNTLVLYCNHQALAQLYGDAKMRERLGISAGSDNGSSSDSSSGGVQSVVLPAVWSWEQLVDAAAAVNGTDFDGDGTVEYGICLDVAPGCLAPALVQAIAASYLQTRGSSEGVLLHPSSMAWRLQGGGFRTALWTLQRLLWYGPSANAGSSSSNSSEAACRRLSTPFAEGRCAFTIHTMSHLKASYAWSGRDISTVYGTRVMLLPGSTRVELAGAAPPVLHDCTATACPYSIPLNGSGSLANSSLWALASDAYAWITGSSSSSAWTATATTQGSGPLVNIAPLAYGFPVGCVNSATPAANRAVAGRFLYSLASLEGQASFAADVESGVYPFRRLDASVLSAAVADANASVARQTAQQAADMQELKDVLWGHSNAAPAWRVPGADSTWALFEATVATLRSGGDPYSYIGSNLPYGDDEPRIMGLPEPSPAVGAAAAALATALPAAVEAIMSNATLQMEYRASVAYRVPVVTTSVQVISRQTTHTGLIVGLAVGLSVCLLALAISAIVRTRHTLIRLRGVTSHFDDASHHHSTATYVVLDIQGLSEPGVPDSARDQGLRMCHDVIKSLARRYNGTTVALPPTELEPPSKPTRGSSLPVGVQEAPIEALFSAAAAAAGEQGWGGGNGDFVCTALGRQALACTPGESSAGGGATADGAEGGARLQGRSVLWGQDSGYFSIASRDLDAAVAQACAYNGVSEAGDAAATCSGSLAAAGAVGTLPITRSHGGSGMAATGAAVGRRTSPHGNAAGLQAPPLPTLQSCPPPCGSCKPPAEAGNVPVSAAAIVTGAGMAHANRCEQCSGNGQGGGGGGLSKMATDHCAGGTGPPATSPLPFGVAATAAAAALAAATDNRSALCSVARVSGSGAVNGSVSLPVYGNTQKPPQPQPSRSRSSLQQQPSTTISSTLFKPSSIDAVTSDYLPEMLLQMPTAAAATATAATAATTSTAAGAGGAYLPPVRSVSQPLSSGPQPRRHACLDVSADAPPSVHGSMAPLVNTATDAQLAPLPSLPESTGGGLEDMWQHASAAGGIEGVIGGPSTGRGRTLGSPWSDRQHRLSPPSIRPLMPVAGGSSPAAQHVAAPSSRGGALAAAVAAARAAAVGSATPPPPLPTRVALTFSTVHEAVFFCVHMQAMLINCRWPAEVLKLPGCQPVVVRPRSLGEGEDQRVSAPAGRGRSAAGQAAASKSVRGGGSGGGHGGGGGDSGGGVVMASAQSSFVVASPSPFSPANAVDRMKSLISGGTKGRSGRVLRPLPMSPRLPGPGSGGIREPDRSGPSMSRFAAAAASSLASGTAPGAAPNLGMPSMIASTGTFSGAGGSGLYGAAEAWPAGQTASAGCSRTGSVTVLGGGPNFSGSFVGGSIALQAGGGASSHQSGGFSRTLRSPLGFRPLFRGSRDGNTATENASLGCVPPPSPPLLGAASLPLPKLTALQASSMLPASLRAAGVDLRKLQYQRVPLGNSAMGSGATAGPGVDAAGSCGIATAASLPPSSMTPPGIIANAAAAAAAAPTRLDRGSSVAPDPAAAPDPALMELVVGAMDLDGEVEGTARPHGTVAGRGLWGLTPACSESPPPPSTAAAYGVGDLTGPGLGRMAADGPLSNMYGYGASAPASISPAAATLAWPVDCMLAPPSAFAHPGIGPSPSASPRVSITELANVPLNLQHQPSSASRSQVDSAVFVGSAATLALPAAPGSGAVPTHAPATSGISDHNSSSPAVSLAAMVTGAPAASGTSPHVPHIASSDSAEHQGSFSLLAQGVGFAALSKAQRRRTATGLRAGPGPVAEGIEDDGSASIPAMLLPPAPVFLAPDGAPGAAALGPIAAALGAAVAGGNGSGGAQRSRLRQLAPPALLLGTAVPAQPSLGEVTMSAASPVTTPGLGRSPTARSVAGSHVLSSPHSPPSPLSPRQMADGRPSFRAQNSLRRQNSTATPAMRVPSPPPVQGGAMTELMTQGSLPARGLYGTSPVNIGATSGLLLRLQALRRPLVEQQQQAGAFGTSVGTAGTAQPNSSSHQSMPLKMVNMEEGVRGAFYRTSSAALQDASVAFQQGAMDGGMGGGAQHVNPAGQGGAGAANGSSVRSFGEQVRMTFQTLELAELTGAEDGLTVIFRGPRVVCGISTWQYDDDDPRMFPDRRRDFDDVDNSGEPMGDDGNFENSERPTADPAAAISELRTLAGPFVPVAGSGGAAGAGAVFSGDACHAASGDCGGGDGDAHSALSNPLSPHDGAAAASADPRSEPRLNPESPQPSPTGATAAVAAAAAAMDAGMPPAAAAANVSKRSIAASVGAAGDSNATNGGKDGPVGALLECRRRLSAAKRWHRRRLPPPLQRALAICESGQGGFVLLDGSTYGASSQEALQEQCMILHMGDYVLADSQPPLDLYLALDFTHLARLCYLRPLACREQLSLGLLSAPVNAATICFTLVAGMQTLLAWNTEVAKEALGVLRDAVLPALLRHGGYLVEDADGLLLTAFPSSRSAVAWALECQAEAKHLDWPEELLSHALGEAVYIEDDLPLGEEEDGRLTPGSIVQGGRLGGWAPPTPPPGGSGHQQQQRGRHLVFRGLRFKSGLDCGDVLARVHTTTGRMTYRGRVMNRAARIAGMATPGQVLCSRGLWDDSGLEAAPDLCEQALAVGESMGEMQLKGLSSKMEIINCIRILKVDLVQAVFGASRELPSVHHPRITFTAMLAGDEEDPEAAAAAAAAGPQVLMQAVPLLSDSEPDIGVVIGSSGGSDSSSDEGQRSGSARVAAAAGDTGSGLNSGGMSGRLRKDLMALGDELDGAFGGGRSTALRGFPLGVFARSSVSSGTAAGATGSAARAAAAAAARVRRASQMQNSRFIHAGGMPLERGVGSATGPPGSGTPHAAIGSGVRNTVSGLMAAAVMANTVDDDDLADRLMADYSSDRSDDGGSFQGGEGSDSDGSGRYTAGPSFTHVSGAGVAALRGMLPRPRAPSGLGFLPSAAAQGGGGAGAFPAPGTPGGAGGSSANAAGGGGGTGGAAGGSLATAAAANIKKALRAVRRSIMDEHASAGGGGAGSGALPMISDGSDFEEVEEFNRHPLSPRLPTAAAASGAAQPAAGGAGGHRLRRHHMMRESELARATPGAATSGSIRFFDRLRSLAAPSLAGRGSTSKGRGGGGAAADFDLDIMDDDGLSLRPMASANSEYFTSRGVSPLHAAARRSGQPANAAAFLRSGTAGTGASPLNRGSFGGLGSGPRRNSLDARPGRSPTTGGGGTVISRSSRRNGGHGLVAEMSLASMTMRRHIPVSQLLDVAASGKNELRGFGTRSLNGDDGGMLQDSRRAPVAPQPSGLQTQRTSSFKIAMSAGPSPLAGRNRPSPPVGTTSQSLGGGYGATYGILEQDGEGNNSGEATVPASRAASGSRVRRQLTGGNTPATAATAGRKTGSPPSTPPDTTPAGLLSFRLGSFTSFLQKSKKQQPQQPQQQPQQQDMRRQPSNTGDEQLLYSYGNDPAYAPCASLGRDPAGPASPGPEPISPAKSAAAPPPLSLLARRVASWRTTLAETMRSSGSETARRRPSTVQSNSFTSPPRAGSTTARDPYGRTPNGGAPDLSSSSMPASAGGTTQSRRHMNSASSASRPQTQAAPSSLTSPTHRSRRRSAVVSGSRCHMDIQGSPIAGGGGSGGGAFPGSPARGGGSCIPQNAPPSGQRLDSLPAEASATSTAWTGLFSSIHTLLGLAPHGTSGAPASRQNSSCVPAPIASAIGAGGSAIARGSRRRSVRLGPQDYVAEGGGHGSSTTRTQRRRSVIEVSGNVMTLNAGLSYAAGGWQLDDAGGGQDPSTRVEGLTPEAANGLASAEPPEMGIAYPRRRLSQRHLPIGGGGAAAAAASAAGSSNSSGGGKPRTESGERLHLLRRQLSRGSRTLRPTNSGNFAAAVQSPASPQSTCGMASATLGAAGARSRMLAAVISDSNVTGRTDPGGLVPNISSEPDPGSGTKLKRFVRGLSGLLQRSSSVKRAASTTGGGSQSRVASAGHRFATPAVSGAGNSSSSNIPSCSAAVGPEASSSSAFVVSITAAVAAAAAAAHAQHARGRSDGGGEGADELAAARPRSMAAALAAARPHSGGGDATPPGGGIRRFVPELARSARVAMSRMMSGSFGGAEDGASRDGHGSSEESGGGGGRVVRRRSQERKRAQMDAEGGGGGSGTHRLRDTYTQQQGVRSERRPDGARQDEDWQEVADLEEGS